MLSRPPRARGWKLKKVTNLKQRTRGSAYQKKIRVLLKNHNVGFSAVDFTGVLTVADVDLFKVALFNGIGRSKAFGCGMLLIRRI